MGSYSNEIAQYTAIDVRNAAFKASVCESNRLIRGQGKIAASPFTSYHYLYVDRIEIAPILGGDSNVGSLPIKCWWAWNEHFGQQFLDSPNVIMREASMADVLCCQRAFFERFGNL